MTEQLPLFADALPLTPVDPSSGLVVELGLTLWQPWAWCVSDSTKRIENRPWAPWPKVIGRFIAIHAAAKIDVGEEKLTRALIRQNTGVEVPDASTLPRGAIVAVARVVGFVTKSDDAWFMGPFGWSLREVITLAAPVPCRGMQGLFPLPADTRGLVEQRAMEARR